MTLLAKQYVGKLSILLVAVVGTMACVFLLVRHKAFSATVSRPGAASSNVQTFAFPARSGKSTFDVVSLPETDYSEKTEKGTVRSGSSIFSAWDGTSTASNYLNLAHMGQKSETSDSFLLQFFNQELCIADPSGKSVPGNMLSQKFTATFTKPSLNPRDTSKTTIRAYDHFEVVWGNGSFTVTITRYWRSIKIPSGKTAGTLSPNDYFIEQPLDSDVPSPGQPVTATLTYTGEFAPFSTRIDHGQPYDTDTFARPADVLVDGQSNLDFNYFDITTEAEGQGTTPDEVSCRLNQNTKVAEKTEPCGCLNNNNVKACGDKVVPFIDLWPPVQFSLATGTQWQIKDVDELKDSLAAYSEQFAADAIVRLDLNTYDASQGERYQLTAFPFGFKTATENLYFSWCFNGKSQQGLVAGGDWVTDTQATTATQDADSSGCCNLVTRKPTTDANGDGIDDDWQKRFGFKLTGDANYLLPANYDGDASGSKATTGLSGDGFVADQFLDANGERIALTPGSVNSKTGEKYITGDGKFTAAEEYMWGTDPTQNDTDQDGYPDEADIVGVGQKQIDFLSQLQPREFPGASDAFGNDRYNIKLKALGRIPQSRTSEDQVNSGSELPNVTRISEQVRNIFAQDPGEMTVALTATPESPGLHDVVNLKTSLVLGTRLGGNPVFYWYAKRTTGVKNNPGTGQPDGTTPFLQGEGINKVSKTIQDICPECQPGDELQITVQVDDTVRGQVATDSVVVQVGGTNSLQVFQDCNKDGSDDEVGSATYCFASQGVTKNVPVRISAAFLNLDPSQYYFQWRLNNTLQTSNCLPGSGTTATAPVKCSFGTSQMIFTPRENQSKYDIELVVYRNDRPDIPPAQFNPTPSVQVARFNTTILSGVPAVTIVYEPQTATTGGGYPVGTTVTARAKVDFLDPRPKGQLAQDTAIPGTTNTPHVLRYVWYNAAHEVLKVEEIPSIDGSTLAVSGTNPGVSELYVDVTSPDYVSSTNHNVPIVVSGAGETYFENGQLTASLAGRIQARLASVLSFMPTPVVTVIRYFAVLVFGGVIVLAIATVPKKSKKKPL